MALHPYQKHLYARIGIATALIVLPIVGFFAGAQYQKQLTPDTTSTANPSFSNLRVRNRGNIGTVKSISDTSITVTSRLDNADKTYTINGSTAFKNASADAKITDIKVGDIVMVTLEGGDATKAATITVNPQLPRMRSGDTPSASIE